MPWQKAVLGPKAVNLIRKSPNGIPIRPIQAVPYPTENNQFGASDSGPGERSATIPSPVSESQVETMTRALHVRDYEVNEMDTNTVNKTQMTGRGRYSNTTIAMPGPAARVGVIGKEGEVAAKSAEATPRVKRNRDTQTGMEILDLDFLLSVIENTDATTENDITMRRLGFNELIRTNRVNEIDSASLKVYAMDEHGWFSKDIQCESFKELTNRTLQHAVKASQA
jgi:hypothetical protein